MYATHRVKDNNNNTIGFIINNEFYPDYYVRDNINHIENLTLIKGNVIRAKQELPTAKYTDIVNQRAYTEISKENPFQRDIQSELLDWKNDSRHVVLQLEGTRQVGKTTELLKFAYKNYDYIIYVNIADDIHDFKSVLESPRMISSMQEYCQKAYLPTFENSKNTILIIDEIQNNHEVYNSIRRMHSTFKCDIVVSGSYLGRILGNKDFFLPAGTIEAKQLFTLSFREFCKIWNEDKLLDTISLYGKSSIKDYATLENLYNIYREIGGYPEVIKKYLQTHNIEMCYEIIDKLLKTFKEESRNYFNSPRDVEIFESAYREALKEMCNEKKGTGNNIIEKITQLTKNNTDLIVNKNEIANAIMWLQYTGIISTCDLAEKGDIRNIIPSRRMYFSDCGLASYLAGKSVLTESALTGLVTETFIFNELYRLFKIRYSKRVVRGDNVCFSIFEDYELDFMIMSKDRLVYGIEGKTKKGKPNSLKFFISKHFVDKGIKAMLTIGGRGDAFNTIPVYTVGCRFPYD